MDRAEEDAAPAMPWSEGLEAALALWLVGLVAVLAFLAGARRLHTWQSDERPGGGRRTGKRFEPAFKLRVFKRNTHVYVGLVRDIHKAGMRVLSVEPVSDTVSLELEITAPPNGDEAQLIPVRARRVWQETDDGGIEIGLRFTGLSRDASQALEALGDPSADSQQVRQSGLPGE